MKKSNKIISFLLALIMVVGCVLTLASCAQSGSLLDTLTQKLEEEKNKAENACAPDAHDFVDYEVLKEATVAMDGLGRYTCSVCGETKLEVIPALVEQTKDTTLFDYIRDYLPDANYAYHLEKGTFVDLGTLSALIDVCDLRYVVEDGDLLVAIDFAGQVKFALDPKGADPTEGLYKTVVKAYVANGSATLYLVVNDDVKVKGTYSLDDLADMILAQVGAPEGVSVAALQQFIAQYNDYLSRGVAVINTVEANRLPIILLLAGLKEAVKAGEIELPALFTEKVDPESEDPYKTYILDEGAFSAFVDAIGDMNFADILETLFGEEEAEKTVAAQIVDFVDTLPEKKVSEIVDMVTTYAEATGVSADTLFALVDALIGAAMDDEEFSVAKYLETNGEKCVYLLLGYEDAAAFADAKQEEWTEKYTEVVNAVLSTELGDALSMIPGVADVYSALCGYAVMADMIVAQYLTVLEFYVDDEGKLVGGAGTAVIPAGNIDFTEKVPFPTWDGNKIIEEDEDDEIVIPESWFKNVKDITVSYDEDGWHYVCGDEEETLVDFTLNGEGDYTLYFDTGFTKELPSMYAENMTHGLLANAHVEYYVFDLAGNVNKKTLNGTIDSYEDVWMPDAQKQPYLDEHNKVAHYVVALSQDLVLSIFEIETLREDLRILTGTEFYRDVEITVDFKNLKVSYTRNHQLSEAFCQKSLEELHKNFPDAKLYASQCLYENYNIVIGLTLAEDALPVLYGHFYDNDVSELDHRVNTETMIEVYLDFAEFAAFGEDLLARKSVFAPVDLSAFAKSKITYQNDYIDVKINKNGVCGKLGRITTVDKFSYDEAVKDREGLFLPYEIVVDFVPGEKLIVQGIDTFPEAEHDVRKGVGYYLNMTKSGLTFYGIHFIDKNETVEEKEITVRAFDYYYAIGDASYTASVEDGFRLESAHLRSNYAVTVNSHTTYLYPLTILDVERNEQGALVFSVESNLNYDGYKVDPEFARSFSDDIEDEEREFVSPFFEIHGVLSDDNLVFELLGYDNLGVADTERDNPIYYYESSTVLMVNFDLKHGFKIVSHPVFDPNYNDNPDTYDRTVEVNYVFEEGKLVSCDAAYTEAHFRYGYYDREDDVEVNLSWDSATRVLVGKLHGEKRRITDVRDSGIDAYILTVDFAKMTVTLVKNITLEMDPETYRARKVKEVEVFSIGFDCLENGIALRGATTQMNLFGGRVNGRAEATDLSAYFKNVEVPENTLDLKITEDDGVYTVFMTVEQIIAGYGLIGPHVDTTDLKIVIDTKDLTLDAYVFDDAAGDYEAVLSAVLTLGDDGVFADLTAYGADLAVLVSETFGDTTVYTLCLDGLGIVTLSVTSGEEETTFVLEGMGKRADLVVTTVDDYTQFALTVLDVAEDYVLGTLTAGTDGCHFNFVVDAMGMSVGFHSMLDLECREPAPTYDDIFAGINFNEPV